MNFKLLISKYRADSKGKRDFGMGEMSGGSKKSLPLDDFIEVGFFDRKGQLIEVKRIRVTEIENELSIAFDEEIGKIEIDPHYLLMDVNRRDDVWSKIF